MTYSLTNFINNQQLRHLYTLCKHSEEKEFFSEKVNAIKENIKALPLPYGTDGQGKEAIAHLHYFQGDWDFYVTEKDSEKEQLQAFGLVNGFEKELGYISIKEIIEAGAELDLHFEPQPLKNFM